MTKQLLCYNENLSIQSSVFWPDEVGPMWTRSDRVKHNVSLEVALYFFVMRKLLKMQPNKATTVRQTEQPFPF